MRRKLLLPALAACCLLAVGAPLASASTHRAHAAAKSKLPSKVHKLGVKVSKIGLAVLGVNHGIKVLQDIDLGQTAAINQSIADHTTLKGTVDAIVAGVPAIIDGLTQLKNGLLAIQTALSDPSTGLVGLNHARPWYGAFKQDGTFIDGTGAHGSSGPTTNAVRGKSSVIFGAGPTFGDLSGFYVVNYATDVSSRVFQVNPFPGGPSEQASLGASADTPGVAQVVDCASSASTANLCYNVENTASGTPYDATDVDSNVNKVLIQFGTGAGSATPSNGFTVTAISG